MALKYSWPWPILRGGLLLQLFVAVILFVSLSHVKADIKLSQTYFNNMPLRFFYLEDSSVSLSDKKLYYSTVYKVADHVDLFATFSARLPCFSCSFWRPLTFKQYSLKVVMYLNDEGTVLRSEDEGANWSVIDGVPEGVASTLIQHPFSKSNVTISKTRSFYVSIGTVCFVVILIPRIIL